MSEMIGTTVHVRVPATWVGEPKTVGSRYSDITWEVHPPPRCLEGLGEYLGETTEWDPDIQVFTFEGSSNYGLSGIEEWLSALEELGVPYRAMSDPKYEYGGETRIFDGHNQWGFESDGGGAVYGRGDFMAVADMSDEDIGRHVRGHFALDVAVETFSIDHLPEREPSEDDEVEPEDARAML